MENTRVQKFYGDVIAWLGALALLAGIGEGVYEAVFWLKYAYRPAITNLIAIHAWQPSWQPWQTDWSGVQVIFDWGLRQSFGLTLLFGGLLVFGIGISISSKAVNQSLEHMMRGS